MKLLAILVLICSSAGCSHAQQDAPRNPNALPRLASLSQLPVPTVAVLYVARVPDDSIPEQYRGWYADAERCTGLRGDFGKVKWFTTAHPWHKTPKDTTWALWQEPHRITINAEGWMDSTLVVHESIHDILSYQRLYEQGEAHPATWFGEGKCANRGYHRNWTR